jgi:hypothetical protein
MVFYIKDDAFVFVNNKEIEVMYQSEISAKD